MKKISVFTLIFLYLIIVSNVFSKTVNSEKLVTEGFEQKLSQSGIARDKKQYFRNKKKRINKKFSSWNKYVNKEFGFEFRYPKKINETPVLLFTEDGLYYYLLGKEPQPLFPVEGFKPYCPYPSNKLYFLFYSFDEYENSRVPHGTACDVCGYLKDINVTEKNEVKLIIVKDLERIIGYLYDPQNDEWFLSGNSDKKITWEEVYKLLEDKYSTPDFPVLSTLSGYKAFPFRYFSQESELGGYIIFNRDKRVVLRFAYEFPVTIPDCHPLEKRIKLTIELIREREPIKNVLKQIVKTVRFY